MTAVRLIQGVATSFLLTSFVDRIFLAVTQTNKLGTLTLAATHRSSTQDDAPSYSISTLLGVRSSSGPQHLVARRLIESLSQSKQPHMAAKSLLLSLGLKKAPRKPATTPTSSGEDLPSLSEEELAAVREIVDQVEKMKQW